jgi:hypothetical protein
MAIKSRMGSAGNERNKKHIFYKFFFTGKHFGENNKKELKYKDMEWFQLGQVGSKGRLM